MILEINWTSQSADTLVTIEGGNMEYSNDGGTIWQQLRPGIDICLRRGVPTWTKPEIQYQLREEVACTVTKCGFTNHTASAFFSGEMIALGGTLVDMDLMFFNCLNLNKLNVSGLNTSNVDSMLSTFYNSNAIDLDISAFDTRKVVNLRLTFNNCKNITSLDFTGWNTTSVTDFTGTFSGCEALPTLDLTTFNTENATTFSSMFAGCIGLIDVDTSRFNTSNVANMSLMFSGCSSLLGVDISSFDTNQTRVMMGMFSGCASLECISNLNTLGAINGRGGIFNGCISLLRPEVMIQQALTTPTTGAGGNNWTNTGACPSPMDPLYIDWDSQEDDTYVTIENADMYYSNDGGVTYSTLTPGRRVLPVGFGPYSLQEIVNGSVSRCAFDDAGCSSRFDGDMRVRGGALTSMKRMFFECTGLKALNVALLNTGWVRDTTDAFSNCSGLNALNVSNFDTVKVDKMSGMFNGCSGLDSLDLSSFDTSMVYDMSSMFAGCTNLKHLNLSSFNTSQVLDFSYLFWACSSMLSIDISAFDAGKALNTTQMFSQCCSLIYLDLSSFDTSMVNDLKAMFRLSPMLKCITNLDSTNAYNQNGRNAIFEGCDALIQPDADERLNLSLGARWVNLELCPDLLP